IDGRAHAVVGVLPAEVAGMEVFTPLAPTSPFLSFRPAIALPSARSPTDTRRDFHPLAPPGGRESRALLDSWHTPAPPPAPRSACRWPWPLQSTTTSRPSESSAAPPRRAPERPCRPHRAEGQAWERDRRHAPATPRGNQPRAGHLHR